MGKATERRLAGPVLLTGPAAEKTSRHTNAALSDWLELRLEILEGTALCQRFVAIRYKPQ
jgi:hypothetical protein